MTYSVNPPNGKGHPFLMITMPSGAELKFHVTCTPRGSGNANNALARLRKKMAETA